MGQTFKFTFSDTISALNITTASMQFSTSTTTANTCLVTYDKNRGTLSLNGGAVSSLSGPLKLANKQCTVRSATVSASGTVLTISLDIKFTVTFTGNLNTYMYAADSAYGTSNGWLQKGTWITR